MNIFKNLVLLFVVGLICLVFLEFSMRLLKLHGDTDPTYIIESDELPFQMKPNTTAKSIYGKEFSINNHGLRGPNFVKDKSSDIYRIMILGDSVAFGFCVDYEDTFSGILDRTLNQTKNSAEIINAAHNGFNINDAYNYLKYYGLEFNPDLVILSVTASDNTDQSVTYIIKDGMGYSPGSRWMYVPSFVKKALRNSSLYMSIGLAKARIEFIMSNRNQESITVQKETMKPEVEKHLQDIARLSLENSLPLLVVTIPSEHDVKRGFYEHDFFTNISQKRDEIKYDYIDTLSQFDPSKQNYCLNDGAHPSKYGHSTIAEILYEEIISSIKSNSDIR